MMGFLRSAAAGRRRTKRVPPVEITVPGTDIVCTLRRSARRTLSLTIRSDLSLAAAAPLGASDAVVEAFLASRRQWILKKLEYFSSHRGLLPDFREGGEIPHLGIMRRLVGVPPARGRAIRIADGTMEVPCAEASPAALLKAYAAWRLPEAKRLLAPMLSELDARACGILGDGRHFTSLTVRSLKSRWGSCSVKGSIVLASQLVELPPELIEFVMIHELCHLRRMDHSPQFHALLSRLLPDAPRREAAIRAWSLEHPRIV